MKKTLRGKLMAVIMTLAMIISLVPAVTINASAATTEQFTLSPGGTYYFDLSAKLSDIKYDSTATINTALPDVSLKWVPFTYAGTVDAYSRTSAGVSADGSITVSSRSLFMSDYAVSTNVSWDGLDSKGLIFGTAGGNYTANGVSYNLRSLSMGSAGNGSGDAARGAPSSNEWDQVLNKNSSYIKFQNHIFCWGQDTLGADSSVRVGRSWESIRYFGNNSSWYRDAYDGFRPVLEILNAGTLGENGLKTVTYNMGENGKLGSSTGSLTQAAVVYTGTLTLPAVTTANGFYYTGTVPAGKTLGWMDSSGNYYAAGTKLSDLATGTVLKAVTVPIVTAVSPNEGITFGGTSVTITGANFTGASAVKFGDNAATSYTVNTSTSITAKAPAGSVGTVDITVITAAGTSATGSADQYNYITVPSATTGIASGVTSTAVTLSGTVNANNASTTVSFEYGTTASYGSSVTATPASVTGTSATSVSCAISGLIPNTTYHFRVKGVNSAGTANGSDSTFTTIAIAPTATTLAAGSINSTAATLNGTVNANNSSTTVTFEYGTTDSYGSFVTAAQSPIVGTSAISVNSALSGLTSNTKYHFRVKSVNKAGTTYGDDKTFTTSPTPTVSAISPNSGLTTGGTSVTITGTNFTGAISVTIGGVAATSIMVVNATTITATTPVGTAGAANVAVTTPEGTGTGTGLFTYVAPTGGGASADTSKPVIVNNQPQDAGTSNTQTVDGQKVTTVTVDPTKLDKILETSSDKPTVTLPGSTGSASVVGELTGQTVKNMEKKEAVLEIKTENVTYTLPASQINIDDVSAQIGSQVALKDIKVSVSIAEPPADTVKIVENTASKGNYQIVVKPVEFEITCTSGGKTVEVSKFNGYVERTVAIPDGVDPSKITTGIVLNSDGTFSHVPTQITVINGKYYAKINSLTNSTYSVIWNPVTFTDVANHWSKNAVNDMGSRMVVTGMGNGTYEPDRSITRAEFAAIVVRALGLKKGTTESAFGDVSSSDWFNGYVDTATDYSLITGYDSASYGPNDTITREQAMAILARAMKKTGLYASLTDSEVNALLANYTDGASVSDYAKAAAALCIKTGVVSGSSATTLSPKSYVTRAEVAVMVRRLLQKSGLI